MNGERWSPVQRGDKKRPEARKPVSQRSAEEQGKWREAREAQEQQDPWEARRQELAERGDVFDAQGNITPDGEALLRKGGWTNEQMIQMERMQKNHVGAVEIIREEPQRSSSEGKMSSSDRAVKLAKARQRAQEEFERRSREQEQSTDQGARQMAGVRAYNKTFQETGSREQAAQAQARAERAYDIGANKRAA